MKFSKNSLILIIILLLFLFVSKLLESLLLLFYVWKLSSWPKKTKIISSVLICIGLLIVVLSISGLFAIKPYQISGDGMIPTLKKGDKIPALAISLKRSEIIVHKFPNEEEVSTVRRIIGLPGESLTIKNGHVFINGQLLDEKEYEGDNLTSPGKFIHENREIKIPIDSVIVMGDNRGKSVDSRDWGLLNLNLIKGKYFLRY